MKSTSGLMALGALATLLVPIGPVRAATVAPEGTVPVAQGPAPADQPPPIRPMTDGEKAAAACAISTVGTMGVVYAIGPSEVVMTVVGGMIVPSSSPVLFVGLISTIASMACGAAAAFTPALLWGWRHLGFQEEKHGGDQSGVGQPGVGKQGAATKPGRQGFARLDTGMAVPPGFGDAVNAQAPKAAP